ncbi:MAG: hydrogenase maturation protease [Caldiserica bacterium]|nr:hydrogenase maturation protease [Caldisericota bacterium]
MDSAILNCNMQEGLKDLFSRKALFVGLGNELKGDDGAGVFLVKELSRIFSGQDIPDPSRLPAWNFLIAGVAPENFLGKLSTAEIIVFVDACYFGEKAGEIAFVNPKELKGYGFTHSFSPALIEYLNTLGKKVLFLGIAPKNLSLGEGLSTEVKKGIEEFIGNVRECMNLP